MFYCFDDGLTADYYLDEVQLVLGSLVPSYSERTERLVTHTFRMGDVTVGLSDVAYPRSGAAKVNAFTAQRAGSIVGLSLDCSAALTAGSATVTVRKNSTPLLSLSLTSGNSSASDHYNRTTHSFDAGDHIDVLLTTSGDFAAGAGPELLTDLLVDHHY